MWIPLFQVVSLCTVSIHRYDLFPKLPRSLVESIKDFELFLVYYGGLSFLVVYTTSSKLSKLVMKTAALKAVISCPLMER